MVIGRYILFEEEDRPLLRKALHKVLRTLDNEIPAKMGKADDRCGTGQILK
jgi:hypothetical protein